MLEKNTLLNRIDEAISREGTSPKNAELLEDVKEELLKANNKEEYTSIVLRIIDMIGVFAKMFINSE